jgi:hypothetical protein
VQVNRGSTSVAVTADQPEPKLQTRWPAFSIAHGFTTTLPFQGSGGLHSICLAVPGRTFSDGTANLGCLDYFEEPQLTTTSGTVTVGQPLPYRADMLDPSADVVLNLRSAAGFYLLPWRTSDVGIFTADAAGHAAGSIPTDQIPPGDYQLVFACSSGCSHLRTVFTIPKVMLPGGSMAKVGFGPTVTIAPNTGAAIVVSHPGPNTVIHVSGSGFPASENVTLIVCPGIAFAEGPIELTAQSATTDANGSFGVNLTISERSTSNIVYASVGDKVLATGVFR